MIAKAIAMAKEVAEAIAMALDTAVAVVMAVAMVAKTPLKFSNKDLLMRQ